MIHINTKIHDQFSIEFKESFLAQGVIRNHNFAVNTWIFVPNSLDVNPDTYGKDQFYRDVKSNVRLITPIYDLEEIVNGSALPLKSITNSLTKLHESQSKRRVADFEYQVKMFSAVTKSAVRKYVSVFATSLTDEEAIFNYTNYIKEMKDIVAKYRELDKVHHIAKIKDKLFDYFKFGDEYLSMLIEIHTFRLVHRVEMKCSDSRFEIIHAQLIKLIEDEKAYKISMGYPVVESDSRKNNRNLVFRHGILKKYIESDLYLNLRKKRDGFAAEQMYFGIAAGMAMVFATLVAFYMQQKYGNFSGPLFISLVISYMLKDRIKELMRFYFAHKLVGKYFDNKAMIVVKGQTMGWMKEGVDFISDSKVPAEVMDLRNRSSLLKAENQIFDEKIILYRKMVFIDNSKMNALGVYPTVGVNDILRLHINRFTTKMDNPQVPLEIVNEEGGIDHINSQKVYYLNVVMQFKYDEQVEYKRFRAVLSRSGVIDIQDMTTESSS